MARLPVRVRVTLAFAGVMAVVLGAAGLFVYLRLESSLDATINDNLRRRAADLTVLVRQGEPVPRGDEENYARVVDRPAGAGLVDRQGAEDRVRELDAPLASGRTLVVGTAIDDRDDALRNLLAVLLVGGPITLLLASLAGYGAAAAALRPVERMRRRAAAIQPGDSARLPVGPADDEVGRLGTTLNEMLGRLEDAYARERAFVADASHELRTPLAILRAELELALREGRSRSELEAAIRSAAEETDRLAALAEDLLVIARVEEGRLPVRPVDVDARELLARFGQAVKVPDGLVVRADPERLQQALGNLVDNALRYGGSAELAAERVNGSVELHVRDDGPGFPPEFLDRAFERFTRADPARGRGGTGLGLAIVDVIARAHGGAAGARNRSGGGADVWISLPCGS
jgi:two-component system OmpR family sensor kinase